MTDYDKVGLLTIRDGKILLCRKRHSTSALILPGGCKEPGESPLDCLARELREELGDVSAPDPELLGVYTDQAAGSESKTVRIELYRAALIGDPTPQSEIAELIWFGQHDDGARLAPSIARKIIPDLIARNILPWNQSPNLLQQGSGK